MTLNSGEREPKKCLGQTHIKVQPGWHFYSGRVFSESSSGLLVASVKPLGRFGDDTLETATAQRLVTAMVYPPLLDEAWLLLALFEHCIVAAKPAWSFRKSRHLIHCHIHSLGPWNSLRSSRLGSFLRVSRYPLKSL